MVLESFSLCLRLLRKLKNSVFITLISMMSIDTSGTPRNCDCLEMTKLHRVMDDALGSELLEYLSLDTISIGDDERDQ